MYFYRGKVEDVLKIEQQLSELEEKASHLDKIRTSTISSISYINDRNRKRNVERAEKAILVEFFSSLVYEKKELIVFFFIIIIRKNLKRTRGKKLMTHLQEGVQNLV